MGGPVAGGTSPARAEAAGSDHDPRSEVLGRFRARGSIAWYWGPTTAVRAVLEAFAECGRLGLARRDGNRRYYDLVERLFPADLLAIRIPEREQRRHKLLSRYRAHGLLGATGSAELWLGIGPAPLRTELRAELMDRGEILPAAVEGLKGQRFIVADELPLLAQAGREIAAEAAGAPAQPGDGAPGASFLAPLDPIMWIARRSSRSTASSIAGRSTRPRRSAAGATTSCRSSLAIGWWGGSSRASIGRAGSSASWAWPGRRGSIRWPHRSSWPHSPTLCAPTSSSAAQIRWCRRRNQPPAAVPGDFGAGSGSPRGRGGPPRRRRDSPWAREDRRGTPGRPFVAAVARPGRTNSPETHPFGA